MSEKPPSKPKVAFFDLENSPSLGWFYELYKEGNIVATESSWFLLSFAWKHPKSKTIHCKGLNDYPDYAKNKTRDRELVQDLWTLFDSHDVLIGQNIDRFDIRKANSRFLFWGLKPPSPYRTVDTLKIARRIAKQDSNRLGDLSRFFGHEDKLPTHGWNTWRGAMNGNRKDWDDLKKYNKHDVLINELVYDRLAPWLPNHPSLIAHGAAGCPVCASTRVIRQGFKINKTGKTQRLQCTGCGHWWLGERVAA